MQMEVKHRLAAVGVGVGDHAIAFRGDAGVLRDVPGKRQQLAEHRRVLRIVERADVDRGNDQEMRGRLRVEVLEGEHAVGPFDEDRKSTRLNSSHPSISYAVFCLKKKKKKTK